MRKILSYPMTWELAPIGAGLLTNTSVVFWIGVMVSAVAGTFSLLMLFGNIGAFMRAEKANPYYMFETGIPR